MWEQWTDKLCRASIDVRSFGYYSRITVRIGIVKITLKLYTNQIRKFCAAMLSENDEYLEVSGWFRPLEIGNKTIDHTSIQAKEIEAIHD